MSYIQEIPDENSHIKHPFAETVPESDITKSIVELGVVLFTPSDVLPSVSLISITNAGTSWELTIDVQPTAGPLTFSIPMDAPRFYIAELRNNVVSAYVQISGFSSTFPTYSGDPLPFLPTVVTQLGSGVISSVSVANKDRARNSTQTFSHPVGGVYTQAADLTGDIVFGDSVNCTIRQNTARNRVQLSVRKGSGQGQPCEQIKNFPGELPPEGSTNGLLEGDTRCNEVVRVLGGVSGPALTLEAGQGFRVLQGPAANEVTIEGTTDTLATINTQT